MQDLNKSNKQRMLEWYVDPGTSIVLIFKCTRPNCDLGRRCHKTVSHWRIDTSDVHIDREGFKITKAQL
jgi:hypothetical protein